MHSLVTVGKEPKNRPILMNYKFPPLIFMAARCAYNSDAVSTVSKSAEADEYRGSLEMLCAAFRHRFPDWLPLRRTDDGTLSIAPDSSDESHTLFSSPDSTIFIEIEDGAYLIEFYKPYLGWLKASEIIGGVHSLYADTLSPRTLSGAMLCYRNRVQIPDWSQLSAYLAVAPQISDESLSDFDAFFVGLKYFAKERRDSYTVEVRRAQNQPSTGYALSVDLQYTLDGEDIVPTSGAMDWFISAHDCISSLFERTFLVKAKEAFDAE